MDANLERCRGLFSDLLRDAYAKNTTQDQCIGAAEAGAYLLGEIERLRAAFDAEPTLTPEQEAQLQPGAFGSILPAIELFKLGWRTAMAHAKRSSHEQSQRPTEG